MLSESASFICPGVVPVLVGPLQVLLTVLPGILLAMLGAMIRLFSPAGFRHALRLAWRQKVTIVVLTLLVGGGIYGYRTFLARSEADVTGTAEKAADWTTARGGLLRTGAVAGSPTPTEFKLVWNYKNRSDFGFVSSPAVVGNRLYITALSLGMQNRGQIFCLDADSGAVVWANSPDGYRPTFSSPVVAGDYLVCGEALHVANDARICCLDAHTGKVLWTVTTQNHVECTPAIYKDRVYVGAGDDGIYCVDLKPGPDGRANVIWHLTADMVQDCETSLAVHDGKVYFGLGIGGNAMCVIDADTGRELKRIATKYPVFSPPTIDVKNGLVYFGMGEGTYPKLGEKGAVRCLKLETLEDAWPQFELPMTVLGCVAVRDDLLYFGCGDGVLYCLSKDGRQVGKFNTHSALKTSPAVTDKAVFLVTDQGMLIALERKTLTPLWDFRLGVYQMFYSSPVVARGHVYVGTEKNGMFCVGESVERPFWPNPLGGHGKSGNDDASPIQDELLPQWSYPALQEQVRCTAAVAVWKDDLFAAVKSGGKTGLVCLPRKTKGSSPPEPRWFFETQGEITQAPVVLDEFVLATVPGVAAKGRLHCLQRDTGIPAWELPITDSGVLTANRPQAQPGQKDRLQILVQDKKDHLTCLDREGKVVWSRPVGSLGRNPADPLSVPLYPMSASNLLVTATWASAAELGLGGKPALMALDRGTGVLMWCVPLNSAPVTSPYAAGPVVYLGSSTGLEARSLLDGKELPNWECRTGPPSADFSVSEDFLAYVNRDGELIFVDRADGSIKGKAENRRALPGFPPLPTGRESVAVLTEKGLAPASFAGDNLRIFPPWAETAEFMPLSAPMVLSDSRLYLPSVNRGLVCIGGKE